MNDNISQPVILITGASGGIGAGVADSLFERGYTRIACQHRSSSDHLGRIIQKYTLDPKQHLFQGDLTNEAYVEDLKKKINEQFGAVDVLINLAGGSTNGLSWKLSLQEFHDVMAMNLTTTFLTCRQFIPRMREKGFGRIINTSSVVAFKGTTGAAHYSAAKAAVVGFTKSLSLELANKNITANTLALGYFDVGIINHVPVEMQRKIQQDIPLKRFGTVKEIGRLVEYLLNDESAYITGQIFHINGGLY